MTRGARLVTAVVVVSVGVLAIPVKQTCGVAGYSCATAPDVYGNIHYYYETQPLVAGAFEAISGQNFPFRYSSGVDLVPVTVADALDPLLLGVTGP